MDDGLRVRRIGSQVPGQLARAAPDLATDLSGRSAPRTGLQEAALPGSPGAYTRPPKVPNMPKEPTRTTARIINDVVCMRRVRQGRMRHSTPAQHCPWGKPGGQGMVVRLTYLGTTLATFQPREREKERGGA